MITREVLRLVASIQPSCACGEVLLTIATAADVPEAGELVRVRCQQWVVYGVPQSRQLIDGLAASVEQYVLGLGVGPDPAGVQVLLGGEGVRSSRGAPGLDEPVRGLYSCRDAVRRAERLPAALALSEVGSANFTSRVMESNLKCGIPLHGDPEPTAIRQHIADMLARRDLERA